MDLLNNLISYLLSITDSRGGWKISRDTILDLLDRDIRDVYTLLVTCNNPLVKLQISDYSDEEAGALITFLECIGFDRAAECFWLAGLWIPYEVQVELQEALIDEIISAKNHHSIDYVEYLSIYDYVNHFPRSVEIYLEEFFSQEEITAAAIREILKTHFRDFGDPAALQLQKLAYELLRRDIVPYKYLFAGLYEKFKFHLITLGRMEEPFSQTASVDAASLESRSVFGFSPDEPVSVTELKKRYKNLMKTYHPDVNPGGLEIASNINRAYSILKGDVI